MDRMLADIASRRRSILHRILAESSASGILRFRQRAYARIPLERQFARIAGRSIAPTCRTMCTWPYVDRARFCLCRKIAFVANRRLTRRSRRRQERCSARGLCVNTAIPLELIIFYVREGAAAAAAVAALARMRLLLVRHPV